MTIRREGITYFWRKDKLEIIERRVVATDFNQSSMLKYLYCPCVIERMGFSGNRFWYGHFGETERYEKQWDPVPKDLMNEEFKLSLLLLGVTL